MPLPRLLAPDSVAHPLYHCYSRIVDRRFIFGPEEKEHFLKISRCYERLCGVRVLTYCVMDNHFHLLVEVPRRPEVVPSEAELLVIIEESLGPKPAQALANNLEGWRAQNNHIAIANELERWYRQMWDLGRFMKMVKQRFTCWYNRRQEPEPRTGTLWEARYRSTLVECGQSLQAAAFYIDLNPVRAGMVTDPINYRWCGYAAATAGVRQAREGLTRMAELTSPAFANRTEDTDSWTAGILAWYRQVLYTTGAERRNEDGEVVRLGFSGEEIDAVRDAQGNLPLAVYLLHRVRYVTFGAILGTQEFVDTVFKERRKWFSPKRRTGARRLKGLARDCPLRCARDLTRRPYG
jgi:putative transposase